MFEVILVPVDGSTPSLKAADMAGDLAAKYGAKLILLHVMGKAGSGRIPEGLQELERIEHVTLTENDALESVAQEILSAARKQAQAQGANSIETVTRIGDSAKVIIEQARDSNTDLIVMGRRGLGDLTGLLLGSVSHKVAQLAECACLTVK